MDTNSITYDRYSNPDAFDERSLEDKVNDLEKTLNAWQDKYIYLKEHVEAIDQRTKIIIHHYNVDMNKIEKSNYE